MSYQFTKRTVTWEGLRVLGLSSIEACQDACKLVTITLEDPEDDEYGVGNLGMWVSSVNIVLCAFYGIESSKKLGMSLSLAVQCYAIMNSSQSFHLHLHVQCPLLSSSYLKLISIIDSRDQCLEGSAKPSTPRSDCKECELSRSMPAIIVLLGKTYEQYTSKLSIVYNRLTPPDPHLF